MDYKAVTGLAIAVLLICGLLIWLRYGYRRNTKRIERLTHRKVVIPLLAGGLGNQLFQIANAYSAAIDTNSTMAIEQGTFGGCGFGSHPEKYYATVFAGFPLVDISPDMVIKEKTWTYYDMRPEIKNAFKNHNAVGLEGYWQSESYFVKHRNMLKALLVPRDVVKWLRTNTSVFLRYPELQSSHSACFIGVRRGDYLKNPNLFNPCGMDYYRKAMAVTDAPIYYIASTDMDWCKANFVGDKFKFLEIKDEVELLYTMTLFRNYIISNSSFYWWGSYLSLYDHPTVIAPDKWLFGKDVKWEQYCTVYRDDMKVIEREVEM